MVGDVLIPTSGETSEEISTASCIMLPGVILAGDLNIFRSTKIDGRIMSYMLNHIVNGTLPVSLRVNLWFMYRQVKSQRLKYHILILKHKSA